MKFLVDGVDLSVGGLQQTLYFRGDLGLEMVFQNDPFVRREQFVTLRNFLGQPQGEQVGPFAPILVDDRHA